MANNVFVTTNKELKGFAEQIDNDVSPDQKFRKAYKKFKRPAYSVGCGNEKPKRLEKE